jgi:outer membrane murein-binding lipoprotein Lpp
MMNNPTRSNSGPKRFRVIAEIAVAVIAAGATAFGWYANDARTQAQNQVQTLNVEVNVLTSDNESLASERDELSGEVEQLEAAVEAAGVDVEAIDTVGSGYIELAEAVELTGCGSNSNEWYTDAVKFDGTDYWHGLSCQPYVNSNECCGSGHMDFLVPNDVQLVSGVAGFDDRSADSTMTAEFVIQSVPATDVPLFAETLSFGEIASFELDVSGTTRIRFELIVRDTEGYWTTGAIASWADVQFAQGR